MAMKMIVGGINGRIPEGTTRQELTETSPDEAEIQRIRRDASLGDASAMRAWCAMSGTKLPRWAQP